MSSLAAPAVPPIRASLPPHPSQMGTVPHVLVVDDEEDNRALLRVCLTRKARCTVAGAGSGEEALTILRDPREPSPCLIVLDWMMPVMGGAATLAQIRRDPALASIPVVVFTATLGVEAPGALMVLGKPDEFSALMELARRLCDRARLGGSQGSEAA